MSFSRPKIFEQFFSKQKRLSATTSLRHCVFAPKKFYTTIRHQTIPQAFSLQILLPKETATICLRRWSTATINCWRRRYFFTVVFFPPKHFTSRFCRQSNGNSSQLCFCMQKTNSLRRWLSATTYRCHWLINGDDIMLSLKTSSPKVIFVVVKTLARKKWEIDKYLNICTTFTNEFMYVNNATINYIRKQCLCIVESNQLNCSKKSLSIKL